MEGRCPCDQGGAGGGSQGDVYIVVVFVAMFLEVVVEGVKVMVVVGFFADVSGDDGGT